MSLVVASDLSQRRIHRFLKIHDDDVMNKHMDIQTARQADRHAGRQTDR